MRSILLASAIILSLLVSGCSFSNNKEDSTIKIASVVTTESQILAYIMKYMIEHYTDEEAEIINNLGTGTVVHQAMVNGDANMSAVRYTGTDVTGPLQAQPIKDADKAIAFVQKEFKEDFNQTFFDSYGFENTYAFMVTRETAEKYNLTSVSDLASVAGELEAGVDTSWMNREGDGYKAFVEEYGFDFSRTYPMQIGLVYDAVDSGELDVVLGYTTDGRIASYDLVVLEDDLNFFPPYDASPFADNELLEEKPEVKDAVERLIGTISTETMQELNFLADNNLIEPAVVAEQFLKEHKYFSGGGE
ncbi:osmoprotectant ABC transporter substrate-binding protein [Ureibacillus sinduriensis]|uniref:Glycine/betaine ABC transporter substrate-binding protein n=1 Tax=Ureibacillus sinduriensis BLB-1 = JCM 15800 TaxID=1384057 RepID=A0A0A3HWL4_9BACL|nr:osmoprotectant ABC transporter substrate-binding protein [Ureibacillus sinduriensis]KGR75615.1 glycine/betaine ABC transporter substrate-binding protein [Ureibacillus sinduriensis BLB-1 = JCM 15800]